ILALLSAPDERGALSVSDLAKDIAGLQRYDGVTASFRPPRKKGDPIGTATPSDALPSGAEGRAQRERPVYRDPKLRLSSAVALPLIAESSWRMRGSGRMSTAANGASSACRAADVRALKPHIGWSGVPFMKRMTRLEPIASAIASRIGLVCSLMVSPS